MTMFPSNANCRTDIAVQNYFLELSYFTFKIELSLIVSSKIILLLQVYLENVYLM